MTMLSVAGQLSQIITMPLAAQLCVHSGWSSVYYAHGVVAAILAMLFFAFYRSSPANHPCVTEDELHYITKGGAARFAFRPSPKSGLVKNQPKKDRKVPYGAILTSRSVWAVWIAFLGNSFGFQLIVQ